MKRTELLLKTALFVLVGFGISERIANGQPAAESAPRLEIDADELRELVGQLASDSFRLRQQAHAKLLDLGERLLPLLDELDAPDDNEAKWRLRSIRRELERIRRRREAGPMAGTSWRVLFSDEVKATHSLKEKTITFQADFTFTYVGPSGNGAETWEPLDADGVFRFHYNDKYATYEGQFVGGDTLEGKAHNKKGKSWEWSAKRVTDEDEQAETPAK